MFFTQDDYKKIQEWLQRNSVKDTEFQEADIPLNGNEVITLVQNGHNKKVHLEDLVKQMFSIGIADFVNVSSLHDKYNITLNEAIQLVPHKSRKKGQVITFCNTDNVWKIYQFTGVKNQWNILDLWNDLFDWTTILDVNFGPDEEDITANKSDNNIKLSFKDRVYEPDSHSGLGYKILRKNIVTYNDPTQGELTKNILVQDKVAQSNTIYEIRYDFDLNNQTINIPENSVLQYKGGSLNNGKIIYNNTIIEGIERLNNVITEGDYTYPYTGDETNPDEQLAPTLAQLKKLSTEVTNIADDEDLTKIYDPEKGLEVLQLKDRQYVQGSNSGMGYVILRQNKSFKEQVTKANTIYEIRYDFDLGDEEVEMPKDCVLKFDGGNLYNGKIHGNKTKVLGSHVSNAVFVEGYNIKAKVRASEIGLVSHDESMGEFNAAILKQIFSSDIVIDIDDTYYIEHNEPYAIGSNLVIIGDGKLIIKGTKPFLQPSSGSSININNIHIISSSGTLINATNIDYVINNIALKGCKIDGFNRVIEITSQDLAYNETNFGIKKLSIDGCFFSNIEGTSFRLSNTVISQECVVRNNIVDGFTIVFFEWGWNNNYTHGEENKEYIADCIVENNIAKGNVTNYDYYHTFLLVEANKVYYRNNKISNVINVMKGGVAYDAYVSSSEYYCENNMFTNICQLPINGDFVAGVDTPSQILKSKQGVKVKVAKNNVWRIDFNACRKMVEEYLAINDIGIEYSEEQFRKMNFVSMFGIVDGESFIFDSNVVDIAGGDLGLFYGGPQLNDALIANNAFIFESIRGIQNSGALLRVDNIREKMQFINNNITIKSNKDFPITSYVGATNTTFCNGTIIIENNICNRGLYTECYASEVRVSNNISGYALVDSNFTYDRTGVAEKTYLRYRYNDTDKYIKLYIDEKTHTTLDMVLGASSKMTFYLYTSSYIEFLFKGRKYRYFIKVNDTENSLYTINKDVILYHEKGAESIWNKLLFNLNDFKVYLSASSSGSIQIVINNNDSENNILINIDGELDTQNRVIDALISGPYSNKPSSYGGIEIGSSYFCIDKQTTEGASNGIMIYHKGGDVWVDALGRIIS